IPPIQNVTSASTPSRPCRERSSLYAVMTDLRKVTTESRAATMRSGAGRHRNEVPEVTFVRAWLERSAMRAQASGMWTRLRNLIEPMNVAAYVAWLAIGMEIWRSAPSGTGVIAEAWLW